METVLLIAGLVGIGFALNWARDKFWKTANRNVLFRGQHRKGRELVDTPVLLDSALAPEELHKRVVEKVAAPSAPRNAVYPTVYLANATPTQLTYVCGTKLQSIFTVALDIIALPSGSQLRWAVPKWTEADGLVAQISQLEELQRSIVNAVH